MKHETAAKCLAELGNKNRLAIFRYLVKTGPEGAPVGAIQKHLNIPASTLSHHLGRLVNVGLVAQERASRTLYCKPQFERLNEVVEFLKSECCTLSPTASNKEPDSEPGKPTSRHEENPYGNFLNLNSIIPEK